jgi:phosphoenolpyruvate-protein kinase (PTS system EI component)
VTRKVFRGVPASGGVAAGTAVVLPSTGPASESTAAREPFDPIQAAQRADAALDRVAGELSAMAERLRAEGHAAEGDIVEVGALIATDPVLRSEVEAAIAGGADAAQAVKSVADRHAAVMEGLDEPALRERAADIRQVGRRAAVILAGGDDPDAALSAGAGPCILVAEELGPADVLGLLGGSYAGGAAARGGPNSHAAIVARTLRLPLVLGLPREAVCVASGTSVVVDGDAGTLVAGPSSDELEAARQGMASAVRRRSALAAERNLPAVTIDGFSVQLFCNVASEEEVKAGLEAGAEGVGLLRTELPFLEAREWPDEAAHYAMLAPILAALTGREAVVRVLDFGGDKVPSFLAAHVAGASRGLPTFLRAPDALGAQIRAALRAGRDSGARLKILVPMVTSLRELGLARRIADDSALAVGTEPRPLGVMVEVPSAALLADRLAKEADFLSIGTNDLTQHALGVSRADPSGLPALAAHPSILSLIGRVARAGEENGRSVRVCGEAGADPLVVPLLLGLGIKALSVAPSRVDETRARIRRLSFADCREVAREAVTLGSLEDVWELVRNRAWPELP